MYKKHLGFVLNLAALGLFFPGIMLTMFILDMQMMANVNGSVLQSTLIAKELSIVAMVQELWQDQRQVVAALIFMFSVCVPLLKTLLITLAYFSSSPRLELRLLNLVGNMGKWSMADVFVVAVFLAILSTNHADTSNPQQFSFFGLKILFDLSTQTLSAAGQGFYFFTAYCLVSLLGTQCYLAYSKQLSKV